MNNAIINIRKILGGIGAETRQVFEKQFLPIKIDTTEIKFLEPVKFNLRLQNTGNSIRVKGQINSSIELVCGRCLSEFSLPVDWNIDEIFYVGTPLEEGAYTIKDDSIDLGPLAEEEFVLAIPIKPLCDEACKGICPTCGQRIDETHKPHEDMKIDARLEVLKKLLEKDDK